MLRHLPPNPLRLLLLLALAHGVVACSDSGFTGAGGKQSAPRSGKDDGEDDDDQDEANSTGTDVLGGSDGPKTGQILADAASATGTGLNTGADTTTAAVRTPQIILGEDNLKCNFGKQGMTGKVYKLAVNTGALPDFKTMTPVGQVEALNLNVPPRHFTTGFPGVPGMVEWFAIEFYAVFDVPADGSYQFKTYSDDGSKLFVDDNLVVNHDGVHAPAWSPVGTVSLTKGTHKLRVGWFQGPKDEIALQVYWLPPGQTWAIIPADAVKTATDCDLTVVGKFP